MWVFIFQDDSAKLTFFFGFYRIFICFNMHLSFHLCLFAFFYEHLNEYFPRNSAHELKWFIIFIHSLNKYDKFSKISFTYPETSKSKSLAGKKVIFFRQWFSHYTLPLNLSKFMEKNCLFRSVTTVYLTKPHYSKHQKRIQNRLNYGMCW